MAEPTVIGIAWVLTVAVGRPARRWLRDALAPAGVGELARRESFR